MAYEHRYNLKLSCPDRVGIVAAVSSFIAEHNGWIVEAHHYADPDTKTFFMRQEILADSLGFDAEELRRRFAPLAEKFRMSWEVRDTARKPRVVILTGREDHCLNELLYRWRSGDMDFELCGVISNHESCRRLVEWHDVPFHCIAVNSNDKETGFRDIDSRIDGVNAETIVLARFMQILPTWMCEKRPGGIINIHHSFLPSFAGARPYHQAHERGVKFIGATCHYVTAELDQGPIIDQDIIRTNHTHGVDDLIRMGRDVEKWVLARGVRLHLEDRVLLHGNRTIVFD